MTSALLSLVMFLAPWVGAEELAGSRPRSGSVGTPAPVATSVPRCFEDAAELERIKEVQRANGKSPHKYDGYQRLFESAAVGEDELLHRLIYAEVTAGQCGADASQAVSPIAEVILNRVRVRNGNVRAVVFERDQFASSLNLYDESAYRSFLCPKDPRLWGEVVRQVNALRSGAQRGSLGPRAFHYYLFKHSTRFTPPAWTKSYTPAGQVGSESGLCVVAYNNPNWR